jgi:hypothetical protein
MLNGRGHSIATESYARLKIYNILSIKKIAESMKSLENLTTLTFLQPR